MPGSSWWRFGLRISWLFLHASDSDTFPLMWQATMRSNFSTLINLVDVESKARILAELLSPDSLAPSVAAAV